MCVRCVVSADDERCLYGLLGWLGERSVAIVDRWVGSGRFWRLSRPSHFRSLPRSYFSLCATPPPTRHTQTDAGKSTAYSEREEASGFRCGPNGHWFQLRCFGPEQQN